MVLGSPFLGTRFFLTTHLALRSQCKVGHLQPRLVRGGDEVFGPATSLLRVMDLS